MPDRSSEKEKERVPHASRWSTGWLTLGGMVLGALAGLAAGLLPIGAAAGLALGIGLDSLLNNWLNDVR